MSYYLSKLNLTNFRNLEPKTIEFKNGINCIFGNNGNGKTNLLEAIFYLINRKSFKKNTAFAQLISVECEEPQILFSSLFQSIEENEDMAFSGKLSMKGSEWFLNNKPHKKKLDLKTVFINPFDSFLFHTTSSYRRTWIDQSISLLSKEYKSILNKFNSSLRFRNNLLSKKPPNHRDQILVIDEQLADYSFQLIQMRKSFLLELNEFCVGIFKQTFDESHNLEISLVSKFDLKGRSEIQEFYKNNLDKDLIIGHTSSGVHRDDYQFNFDGFNSYEYCSLGQQKMSFLSLLFAYIELFRYKFKTYPIVLIDDVSGELDQSRWNNLITYLKSKEFQVLITTANENFKKELEKIDEAQKIFISDGSIEIL